MYRSYPRSLKLYYPYTHLYKCKFFQVQDTYNIYNINNLWKLIISRYYEYFFFFCFFIFKLVDMKKGWGLLIWRYTTDHETMKQEESRMVDITPQIEGNYSANKTYRNNNISSTWAYKHTYTCTYIYIYYPGELVTYICIYVYIYTLMNTNAIQKC